MLAQFHSLNNVIIQNLSKINYRGLIFLTYKLFYRKNFV